MDFNRLHGDIYLSKVTLSRRPHGLFNVIVTGMLCSFSPLAEMPNPIVLNAV